MSIETGELLYDALKNLVFAAKNVQQKSFEHCFKDISLKAWYKEFCTIKLGCTRRSGHDYCISRFVEENEDSNFVFISPNSSISEILKSEIKKKTNISKNMKFCSRSVNTIISLRGIEHNYVIVNCSCFFSQKNIDDIYSNFFDPKIIFIFIQ